MTDQDKDTEEIEQPKAAAARDFNMFQGLWLCFGSAVFYRCVLNKWKGMALRFLLLVSMVFSTMTVGGIYLKVMSFLESPSTVAVAQGMPMLKIKQGEMSTASGELQLVLDDQRKTAVVIDPKDTLSDLEQAAAPVLLQSKTFTFQLPKQKPIKMKYKSLLTDSDVSGVGILTQLKDLASAVPLLVAVIMTLFAFLMTMLKSLVLALLLRAFRMRQSYIDCSRLLIVAFCPALLLSGLLTLSRLPLGDWDAHLFNGISLLYIIFAFRSCAQQKNAAV